MHIVCAMKCGGGHHHSTESFEKKKKVPNHRHAVHRRAVGVESVLRLAGINVSTALQHVIELFKVVARDNL